MKKVFLTIGILALLVSCGKSEEWKISSYDNYMSSWEESEELIGYGSNEEFFSKNTNLFTSTEKEYGKYLDKDLTVERFIKEGNTLKPTLFREKFVIGSYQIDDNNGENFEAIVRSYDIEKGVGVKVLIFSDKKIDIDVGKTIEVTALPCVLFRGYYVSDERGYEEDYEIELSEDSFKGAKIDNVVGGVATDYKIID